MYCGSVDQALYSAYSDPVTSHALGGLAALARCVMAAILEV